MYKDVDRILKNPKLFKYIFSNSDDPETQNLLRQIIETITDQKLISARIDPTYIDDSKEQATVRLLCINEFHENMTIDLILQ